MRGRDMLAAAQRLNLEGIVAKEGRAVGRLALAASHPG
jgi:hypothetical protein